MDREIDSTGRQIEREETPLREESRPAVSREERPLRGRGYICQLSPAELETLRDVGRFRTVALTDLAQYRYQRKESQMWDDLRSLRAQGLLQRRTIWTGGKGKQISVLVLTKAGKAVLERAEKLDPAQQVYAGFVKPAEVHHDAAIYRMYHAEAGKIAAIGGRIRRVVLDYELKRKIYSPLAKAKAQANVSGPREYARRQAEIAQQNSLKVVRGKILLPDLRIEYETPGGERTHVDLELATHHYRGSQMRAKAEAGFKMYAPQDSVAGLRAAFDPELVARIFSL